MERNQISVITNISVCDQTFMPGINMTKTFCKDFLIKLSIYMSGMSGDDGRTVQIRFWATMTDCKDTMNCTYILLSTIRMQCLAILVVLTRHAVLLRYLLVLRLYVNAKSSQVSATKPYLAEIYFCKRPLHHMSLDIERVPMPRVKKLALSESQKPTNESSHLLCN